MTVPLAGAGACDAAAVQRFVGAANLRYRYPFARQIDVGLPWLIVLLSLVVPLQLSLTTGAFGETVTGGVGTSRFLFMLFGMILFVFPLVHLGVMRASGEMNYNLPRTPLWRSLACASAVLLLSGSLFILSGGTTVGLVLGIIVGVAMCAALVTLLFRLLPHEVSRTVTYAASGRPSARSPHRS